LPLVMRSISVRRWISPSSLINSYSLSSHELAGPYRQAELDNRPPNAKRRQSIQPANR
jgi:hypothetical protein